MNRITAKAILGELLEAYDECEHGDYFYDNGDVVCDAVECILEEPRWISVEERLPELESFVLCRLKGFQCGGNTQVCRYRAADKYVDHPYFDHYRNGSPCVTHWMPLPDAPEVEG